MDQDQPKQPNKVLIAIIVVVLLAAATAAVVFLNKKETPAETTSDTTSQNTADTSSTSDTTASYKDGTFQAAGSYQTPGGREKLTVKVTLANGVISAVDLERDPTTREAEEYQGKFVSGYKAQVIGKKIDDVQLSRVAGSSLTSGGFNQALETIKNDARA